jgi:hypothetical protein
MFTLRREDIKNSKYLSLSIIQQQQQLRGFIPRANYIDQATAACRRS